MSKQKQNICVNFRNYLPYDNIPYTYIPLGKITDDQLQTILNAFEKNTSRPHTCIQTMSIDFHDTMSFGRMPGLGTRYRDLDLANLFYFYDKRKPAPCIAGGKTPQTEDAMLRTCAHNLRCGKCRDEFIRKTLGAVLFPQHYANEKQK